MPSLVQKGDVAELMFTARLLEAGIIVLKPVSSDTCFDLAVYYDGLFYRFQVKRASPHKGTGRFNIPRRQTTSLHKKGSKAYMYETKHADFLVGVVVSTGDLYIFPLCDLPNRTEIQVDPFNLKSKPGTRRKVDPEMYRNILTLGDTRLKL